MSERYKQSELMHERALQSIPLGSQTFSKSKTQYPFGVSPYFVVRGLGSRTWDVDGNEYIDFINGLGAVILGYNDPDVNAAVKRQLENGVTFSLPHPLEVEVAGQIIEMVPCAEMVRFGKNGSDATAGAVRLARAYTRRDHVAVCGYHGWQDWYIGSTSRNCGVPRSTQELTHQFLYNDIDSLRTIFKNWPDQIAAVIMEPMNVVEPKDGFLEKVAELTRMNGAVLIFDEIVTGFRFDNGGAQKYFGVIPDLATFGKALGNGFPISAIAGRAEIMRFLEEVFFSFTFGGETLSLAAASATLTKLQNHMVISTLIERGQKVLNGVKQIIDSLGIEHIVTISGHPVWSFLTFKDVDNYNQWEVKTLFLQEMFARGILVLTTHNMSFSHSDEDVNCLLRAYAEVFALLRDVIKSRRLHECLQCEPLQPLFKIR